MKFIPIICSMILMVSVSNAETCLYEFDQEKASVAGTGFKYSEKTGVKGLFTGIKLNKSEKKSEAKKLLDGLEVTVDLMTLDSGNSLRDKNMRETLFAGILGDSVVKVLVKKVTDKVISTEFKINEKTKAVDFEYSLKGNTFNATGKFDVVDFALNEQVAALKKRCGSLHTGSDGKSVTWTEFDLEITAPLKKTCKSS